MAAPSLAADAPASPVSRCADVAAARQAVAARGGIWIELTSDQWQFLRGVFVLNPNTPPGLPPGDRAALARADGASGALVFFLDGARACTPMEIPDPMVEMIRAVGAATIRHEGDGL